MKKIILSIISILFLCNVAKSAGPSTQYSITLTKGELCEAGSNLVVTNCINPVQLNAPGSTLTVDIAATEAGATKSEAAHGARQGGPQVPASRPPAILSIS